MSNFALHFHQNPEVQAIILQNSARDEPEEEMDTDQTVAAAASAPATAAAAVVTSDSTAASPLIASNTVKIIDVP